MPLQITRPELVVTVPEAKSHLRVDHDDDDAMIDRLIASAQTALGRDYLQRAIGRQTLEQRVSSCWPHTCARSSYWGWRGAAAGWCLGLPMPPLVSVESVKYLDADGVEQTFASTEYEPWGIGATFGGGISLKSGASWPTMRDHPEALRVRYVAGTTADEEDENVKHAILLHVEMNYGLGNPEARPAFEAAIKSLIGGVRVFA